MRDERSKQRRNDSGEDVKAPRPTRKEYAVEQQRREAWLDALGVDDREDRKLFSRLLISGVDLTSVLSERDPVDQVALALELVEKNKRKFDRMEHTYVPERIALRDTMRIGSKAMAAIVEDRDDVRRALLLVARIRAEQEAKIARLTLLEDELLVHFAGLTERQNAAFQALDLGPALIARVLEFHGLLRAQKGHGDAPTVGDFIAWCASRGNKEENAGEVLEALKGTSLAAEVLASNTHELPENRCDPSTSDEPSVNVEETSYNETIEPSEIVNPGETLREMDAQNSISESGYKFEQTDCPPYPAGGQCLSPDLSSNLGRDGSDNVSEQDRQSRVKPMLWHDLEQQETGYDVITYHKPSDQLPPYDEAFMPPASNMVSLGIYAQIGGFDPTILAPWDNPAIGLNHDGSRMMLDRKLALAVAKKAIKRALTEAANAGRVLDVTDSHISMMARFWTFAVVGRNRPDLIMSEWPADFFSGVQGHCPIMQDKGHFWIRGMLPERV
ncbi:MAG: hypothetical protein K5799_04065 [Erythrobacter sp.]|nr:hypothetical protein [Erythrobacter sp.]